MRLKQINGRKAFIMEWYPVLLIVTLDKRNTVSSNLRSSNQDNKDIGVTKRKQKNSNCKGCLKFKLLLISEMKIQLSKLNFDNCNVCICMFNKAYPKGQKLLCPTLKSVPSS